MARPFHIEFYSLRQQVWKRLVSNVCSPWNWWTRSSFLHLLCLTSKLNLPPLRTSAIHVSDDVGEASLFLRFIPNMWLSRHHSYTAEVLTLFFTFLHAVILATVTSIILLCHYWVSAIAWWERPAILDISLDIRVSTSVIWALILSLSFL